MKLLLLLCLMSCKKAEGGDDRRSRGDDLASEIVYIRDPSTELCFAYGFVSNGSHASAVGGPMLATVPCDVVEPFLMNPKSKAENEHPYPRFQ